MTGVSLPGTPAIVVGSNGHVAWGFTNSEGDWVDVVIVETDPNDKDSYLTPDGPRKFEQHRRDHQGQGRPRRNARRRLDDLGPDHGSRPPGPAARDPLGGPRSGRREHGADADRNRPTRWKKRCGWPISAARRRRTSSSPTIKGRIAWTILGRIPRRVGFDGRLPTSWADGTRRWDGYLKPEEYPRIVDPEDGTHLDRQCAGRQRRDAGQAGRRRLRPGRAGRNKFATICWRSKRPARPTCCASSSTIARCFSSRGRSCSWTRSRPRRWPPTRAAASCARWSKTGAAARRSTRSAFARCERFASS